LPKAREAGSAATGATPVPLSCAVWGEFAALSVTVSVPVCAPSEEGVKVSEIVQLAFAAKVLGESGQVVEASANSADGEILLMVSATVCVLLSVMLNFALVVCTGQFPNERLAGVKV